MAENNDSEISSIHSAGNVEEVQESVEAAASPVENGGNSNVGGDSPAGGSGLFSDGEDQMDVDEKPEKTQRIWTPAPLGRSEIPISVDGEVSAESTCS